ncbi:Hypothetical protein NTJ_10532 [Nesidiocoris tenuis]|uniref:Obg domain-containing protein n=1 Tax=Nesidiocoris tenuis TaxID=355587 RepID=A0ABN7B0F8_9HEMI|nr:Hypothetical protein NTJ_10532 [Nesidiocoris tenuis]
MKRAADFRITFCPSDRNGAKGQGCRGGPNGALLYVRSRSIRDGFRRRTDGKRRGSALRENTPQAKRSAPLASLCLSLRAPQES